MTDYGTELSISEREKKLDMIFLNLVSKGSGSIERVQAIIDIANYILNLEDRIEKLENTANSGTK